MNTIPKEDFNTKTINCCGCRNTFEIKLLDAYWNPIMGRGPQYPEVNSTKINYCPSCGGSLDEYEVVDKEREESQADYEERKEAEQIFHEFYY